MRLVDVLPLSFQVSPYLMEANLINEDEVRAAIESVSEKINSPKHRQWFVKAFLKYIILMGDVFSDSESLRREGYFLVGELPGNAPAWAKKKAAEGGRLYKFQSNEAFFRRADIVIPWLNSLKPEKSVNMKFEGAILAARRYELRKEEEAMKAKRKEDLRKGARIIAKYSNGLYWVWLETAECVWDEGERQRNCLRRASPAELDGKTYYSLRDKEGKSLVTLGARGRFVRADEILMAENEETYTEYFRYVIDLMVKKSLVLVDSDQDENGLTTTIFTDIIDHAEHSGYEAHEDDGEVLFFRRRSNALEGMAGNTPKSLRRINKREHTFGERLDGSN